MAGKSVWTLWLLIYYRDEKWCGQGGMSGSWQRQEVAWARHRKSEGSSRYKGQCGGKLSRILAINRLSNDSVVYSLGFSGELGDQ